MRISAPTMPFHLARAYGVRPANAPAPTAPGDPAPPPGPARPAAEPSGVGGVEGAAPMRRPDVVQRLVAGAVPGRIDFSGAEPRPAPDAALPMYRHPADRNAAATGVLLAGRSLDVSG